MISIYRKPVLPALSHLYGRHARIISFGARSEAGTPLGLGLALGYVREAFRSERQRLERRTI